MVDQPDVALASAADDDVAEPDLPQEWTRRKTATRAFDVDPVLVEAEAHFL